MPLTEADIVPGLQLTVQMLSGLRTPVAVQVIRVEDGRVRYRTRYPGKEGIGPSKQASIARFLEIANDKGD